MSALFSVLILAAHFLEGENVLVFTWQYAQIFDSTGMRGKQSPGVYVVTRYFLLIFSPLI